MERSIKGVDRRWCILGAGCVDIDMMDLAAPDTENGVGGNNEEGGSDVGRR